MKAVSLLPATRKVKIFKRQLVRLTELVCGADHTQPQVISFFLHALNASFGNCFHTTLHINSLFKWILEAKTIYFIDKYGFIRVTLKAMTNNFTVD